MILHIHYPLFHFSMTFLKANRIAPDGTPRSAASHLGLLCLPIHLGLLCLPMSHKKEARLIQVKNSILPSF